LGHWHNIGNIRQFLSDYADRMGFDPLQPENWRNVTIKQVAEKVCVQKKKVSPIFLETYSLVVKIREVARY